MIELRTILANFKIGDPFPRKFVNVSFADRVQSQYSADLFWVRFAQRHKTALRIPPSGYKSPSSPPPTFLATECWQDDLGDIVLDSGYRVPGCCGDGLVHHRFGPKTHEIGEIGGEACCVAL